MSNMQQEEYLENDGAKCPYCKSINIYRLSQIDPEMLTSQVECHDCGEIWSETYKLCGWMR